MAGTMTVVDISRKGLKLKIHGEDVSFEKGDLLEVTFPLDNDTETLIKRIVNIKTFSKIFWVLNSAIPSKRIPMSMIICRSIQLIDAAESHHPLNISF